MAKQEAAATSARDSDSGHLAFYEAHKISPVRYQAASLDEHFQRRDSLYRSLGLPPVAFNGARVLEVAAGSGQNSLYVASCNPARLELVEPNSTGRAEIEAAYRAFDRPHTAPILHSNRLQEFHPPEPFDIVIAENWLGSLPHELELIAKLAGLLAPGGVLVLTVVPLSGFFPNVMRKLMALRIMPRDGGFAENTQMLVDVFAPHLSTMAGMTRSHRDWVVDCMVNPHYLNVCLPLDRVLETIGGELELLATFPRFSSDWRWYKSLTGSARGFNRHHLDAYRANAHNFIDYRKRLPPLDLATAESLNQAFAAVLAAGLSYQQQMSSGAADTSEVGEALAQLAAVDDEVLRNFSRELDELRTVWSRPVLRPEDISNMQAFGGLFGRETVYVSMTRPRLGEGA